MRRREGDNKGGNKCLENPVIIPLVHLETLDGHGGSQVFPTAHFRGPIVVENPPNVGLLWENKRSGYDPTGFTHFPQKPQTPPVVFVIEARPRKDLQLMPLVVEALGI